MFNLRPQLKRLRESKNLLEADSFWISENKKRLMREISNFSSVKEPDANIKKINYSLFQAINTFIPQNALKTMRPAFSIAMILIVVFAGWSASVSASFYSLPGDILWNFKIAGEKAQMAVASIGIPEKAKKEIKIKSNFEFAGRRAEEIKKVSESKESDSAYRINIAKKYLQKSIDTAVETVDQEVKKAIVEEDPKKAIKLAKGAQEETATIVKNLKEVTEESSDSEVIKEVNDAAKAASKSGFTPAQTVVENILVGNSEDTDKNSGKLSENDNKNSLDEEVKNGVKDLVSVKLDKVLEDSKKAKENIELAKDPINNINVQLVDMNSTTTTSSTTAISTDKETSLVKDSVAGAEIKQLIADGKLTEAIDKINVIEENIDVIVKDAEQATNDAKEKQIISDNNEEVNLDESSDKQDISTEIQSGSGSSSVDVVDKI